MNVCDMVQIFSCTDLLVASLFAFDCRVLLWLMTGI